MKIGLLLNSINKLSPYCENFRNILIVNNIPYRILDPNSYTLLDELRECTHLLFRHSQGDTDLKIYETITIAHRMYGIKCLPDFESCWQYEDKIKEYYLLKSHGFPIIESRVFWNIEHADAFLMRHIFRSLQNYQKVPLLSMLLLLTHLMRAGQ